jgi:hypothetical protein
MQERFVILTAAAAIVSIATTPPAAAQQSGYFRCDKDQSNSGPVYLIIGPNEMRKYYSPEQNVLNRGTGFLTANYCEGPDAKCDWFEGNILTVREGPRSSNGMTYQFGAAQQISLYRWRSRTGVLEDQAVCTAVDSIPFARPTERGNWENGENVRRPWMY